MILNYDIRPQPKAKDAGKKEKPAKQAPTRREIQIGVKPSRPTATGVSLTKAKKPWVKPMLRVFSLADLGLVCKQKSLQGDSVNSKNLQEVCCVNKKVNRQEYMREYMRNRRANV